MLSTRTPKLTLTNLVSSLNSRRYDESRLLVNIALCPISSSVNSLCMNLLNFSEFMVKSKCVEFSGDTGKFCCAENSISGEICLCYR